MGHHVASQDISALYSKRRDGFGNHHTETRAIPAPHHRFDIQADLLQERNAV